MQRTGDADSRRVDEVYDIAMTVAACLNAGTRADVAWLVDVNDLPVGDWSSAVVFTPGGGKIGSLLGENVDGKLGEMTGRLTTARLVDLEITQVDALIAGLDSTGSARCIVAPADTLPAELWTLAASRERFCLVLDLDGDEVSASRVYAQHSISEAEAEIQDAFVGGSGGSTVTEDRVISVFVAIPQMVIVGAGPIAEALRDLSPLMGWQAHLTAERDTATGLIAPLSGRDMVVIAAHDLELAGSGLAAALESGCGYIGSVGSRKMQADRADWLAYRGVTELSRVHGPAGLDIGAGSPGEVAVAIAAEAIAELSQS